jgi:hypothetical protein
LKKTVKFSISMTDASFKEVESLRLKTGRTRSQLVRDAVLSLKAGSAGRAAVKEERSAYGTPGPAPKAGLEERRRRALAAAGRFRSGITDLSLNHDRYLEDDYAADSGAKDTAKKD